MSENFDISTTVSVISTEDQDISEKEVDFKTRRLSSQISHQEFFDFLSCAFKSSLDPDGKGHYKELSNNEFVTKLLEISVEKFKANVDSDGKINSEFLSLDRSRPANSKLSLHEDEKLQGIRSLFIRINKKPSDPDFSFSQLPILEAENILKSKLLEVIDEGILDSMFPFVISKLNASFSAKSHEDNFPLEVYHKTTKPSSKQRLRKQLNSEAEIEIQVCDEVNNITKNFRCSQSLLLSKMEYFSEVTEGQRLEDMDISVHCDITIFEWLMKWVHRSNKEHSPILNVSNVTPILISAMFLRMEPLVDECVKFFKQNLKEIVETNSSFSCLSDSILEKIADTMTNVELDSLDDSQDKIQSKLFTKFILSLSKQKVEKEKGHFSTLAALFRCCHCKQILHEDSGLSTPCTSEFLAVDAKGNIQGRHKEMVRTQGGRRSSGMEGALPGPSGQSSAPGSSHSKSLSPIFVSSIDTEQIQSIILSLSSDEEFLPDGSDAGWGSEYGNSDSTWNLNSYIKQLKRELSTWKNVYWKLWGTCHYLDCGKCRMSYPLTHSLCCRYHPNGAHFGVRSSTSNLLIPVGRYMCCGSRTHKFDVLGLPNGCMYRPHVPTETALSLKLIHILEKKKAAICLCPSESLLEEEKDLYNLFGWNSSWWLISKGNYIDKMSLFSDILGTVDERDKESDQDIDFDAGIPMKTVLDDVDNASSESEFNDVASVGDGEDSDGSCASKKFYPQPKSQITHSKQWTIHRSVRFNQDNQREREERLIKCLINKLNRNKSEELDFFITKNDFNTCNFSEGGIYVLLEDEWREEFNHPELVSTPSVSTRQNKRAGKYNYF